MNLRNLRPCIVAVLAMTSLAHGQTGLYVETGNNRAMNDAGMDAAVRAYGKNVAQLTALTRKKLAQDGRFNAKIPFSLPTTVHLSRNGRAIEHHSFAQGDITLVFDASGTRSFPAAYKSLLQDVYAAAKPTMDLVFGQASQAGPVLVKNYDADIGDRDAVAGGFFVPDNGAGGREIRFPVYVSNEAAAVNFIHTLLLAYLGADDYGFDAFQEGLVRAAVMKVVRTTGALPLGLDAGLVDSVLQNTYDVSAFYDWYNQRALGGPLFIAPNLRDIPLPVGGSLGGIYLLRYQMSGTAWQKALAENGGFIKEFNNRFYANPAAGSDVNALVAMGQQALDTVAGTANATIEGRSFAEWFKRQFILDTHLSLGPKLLVQPVPITSGLANPDFGVYDVSATYFETQLGGNESLLSGISYPIFWDQSYNRIFPSSQEDRMDIAGAFGSVTPNIPDINGGQVYRCTVDIPVSDKIARAYIPVGSIATAANPTENNFFGTVTGQPVGAGQTLSVRLSAGATNLGTIPVKNFAFGKLISSGLFTGYARLKIEVLLNATVVATRMVNKGPGSLAVDLRVGDAPVSVAILKGIQMVGFPTSPFTTSAGSLLGIPENQVLAARYDSSAAAYDRYPDFGGFEQGNGYFLRSETAGNVSVDGTNRGTAIGVALKPGWNMISNPLNESTTTARIQVVRTTESPTTFSEGIGVTVDDSIFAFQRGANDSATGAPETGSYVAATSFEPGKAYFVRCLAPEGATLLFSPAGAQAKPGRQPVVTGWRIAATVSDGSVAKAPTMFGRSMTATSAIDKEDSPLPPRLVGGLYATLEVAGKDYYRDVKNLAGTETYSLRVDGLTPGKFYTIKLDPVRGGSRRFTIRDYYEFVSTAVTVPATYRFKATKASHRFIITEVRP